MLRRTPLYETHLKYGAKMMPFAGYELPERFPYGSIREHMAVRTACGLFDTCHMPEFICRGPGALDSINYLFTNDYSDLRIGSARYGMMCWEDGGILDDLIVHRLAEDVYLVPMNAACRESDFRWIQDHIGGDPAAAELQDRNAAGPAAAERRQWEIADPVGTESRQPGSIGPAGAEWIDISDDVGSLALQGPLSEQVLRKVADPELIPQGRFRFTWPAEIRGMQALIARTGYSGEDGFEIYVSAGRIAELWELLLEAGREDGLMLCGLGSRDTLRIEAGMPLYGNDLDQTVSPVEAGLRYGVKLDAGDFIGREAILKRGEAPPVRRIGLRVTGDGIIRGGHDVYRNDEKIGKITSGTFCAYVNAAVGMGYIAEKSAVPGLTVSVDVRGKRVGAVLTELPFYTPPYRK